MSDTVYTVSPGGAGTPVTGPGDPAGGSAPVIYSFVAGLIRISPPWLRRTVGGAIVRALATPFEEEVDRMVLGVGLRFPNGAQPDALGLIGSERRILRGPGEDSVTYAARLRTWWDSHRTRGNGFALATQLFAYFTTALNVSVDIIGETGVNHNIAADGTIVRSLIPSWVGAATWARFTVIINLPTAFLPVPDLNAAGEPLGTFTLVPMGALGPAEEALVCAVITEWGAAHIDKSTAVLLAPVGTGNELWGYSGPGMIGVNVGLWADTDPTPGQVWGGSGDVVVIEC